MATGSITLVMPGVLMIRGPAYAAQEDQIDGAVERFCSTFSTADAINRFPLVVVVDDIAQGVNHIVRGSDLLTTTAAHLTLYRQLGAQPPFYAHIPVAATSSGRKLSKQNHARPLDNNRALQNLQHALSFLGFNDIAENHSTISALLSAAIAAWQYNKIPKRHEIIVDGAESTYYNAPES